MFKINHRLGTRKAQHGAVTLIITVIILVAMMLGIVALVVTSGMETRMVSNDQRSRQAMERAQAGIDYLLAGLGAATIDRAYLCADDTRATRGFVIDFRLPPLAPGVSKTNQQRCMTEVPFEILTKLDSIRSWGYSDNYESVRVIESTIDLTTPWNFGTAAGTLTGGGGNAAIVTKGNANLGGQAQASRCNSSGLYLCTDAARPGNSVKSWVDGTLIRAAGSVDPAKDMNSGNYVQNDLKLQSLTNDALFNDFFSPTLDKTAFKQAAYEYIPSGKKLDGGAIAANAGNNQNIYVDGNLDLTGGTLGSPEKPVALFVDGALNITGNPIIWGAVYAKEASIGHGTAKIFGGLVSEGNVDNKGNVEVYFNPNLLPDPGTIDPAGLVATANARDSTVRIGSWRELSLPAAQAPK